MAEVRKYRVKTDWIFQLESMNDRLWCIIIDSEEGKIQFPITIAGTECKDEDDIQNLIEECSELEWTAKGGKVTGKEYGRIKEIAQWRIGARYIACLNAGMSEREAGRCFEEM